MTNYPGSFEKRSFVQLRSCTTGQMKSGDLCRAFVRQMFENGYLNKRTDICDHLYKRTFAQWRIQEKTVILRDILQVLGWVYTCPFSTAHCTNVRLYKYPVLHVSVVQLAVVHVWVVQLCEHLHSYMYLAIKKICHVASGCRLDLKRFMLHMTVSPRPEHSLWQLMRC